MKMLFRFMAGFAFRSSVVFGIALAFFAFALALHSFLFWVPIRETPPEILLLAVRVAGAIGIVAGLTAATGLTSDDAERSKATGEAQ